jgi:hypothetical protein
VVSLSRKVQREKLQLGFFDNKAAVKATTDLSRAASAASAAADTAVGAQINKPKAACSRGTQTPAESKRKYISVKVKKAVWQRADHQCEYTDPRSKRRCGQKRFLHIDHMRPIAQGGSDSFSNLQLLCSAHNLWKSDR